MTTGEKVEDKISVLCGHKNLKQRISMFSQMKQEHDALQQQNNKLKKLLRKARMDKSSENKERALGDVTNA